MSEHKSFCLEIWGDGACFTMPEFKTERVSYDFITPSSARAIFQAIFWKPAIEYKIIKIEVLNPIKRSTIFVNEIKNKMTINGDINILDSKNRQIRTTQYLKDVRYRIWAEMKYIPVEKRTCHNLKEDVDVSDECSNKYFAMFERRALNGQCFSKPYLGCREFSCDFRYVDFENEVLTDSINETRPYGYMFYDFIYGDNGKPTGRKLFLATMQNGKIEIKDSDIVGG